jgi:acyl-CoA dehydrogenase
MIYAMHQIQAACLVRHALGDAWHRDFARRLVTDQLLIASTTSEIGVGGDLRSSRCAVEHADGRFSLAKRSPTMSYGAYADAYLVTARRGADSPPSDQVLVTALRPDVALTRTGGWDGMGLRGSCSEAFDLAITGDSAQVFPVPFADIAADTMLPVSHLLWVAIWLGLAGDAVGRARAYLRAQARRQPGAVPPGAARLARAVGLLQLVQARLQAALAAFDADGSQGNGARGTLAADADLNTLKHDASEMCLDAAQQALRICGMAGYRQGGEHSVGRHLRDLWSGPLMIGNDRVLANTGAMLLAQRAELGAI